MTTKDKINIAMKKLPQLTNFGVELIKQDRNLSTEEVKKEQLLNNTKEFERVCDWLQSIDKIKTINKKHTSYELKHIAEKHIGYLTNGTFIAAAIYSGFKFQTIDGSPNVMFGMSEKSLKKQQTYYN